MDLLSPQVPTPLTALTDDRLLEAGVKIFIKRDDLIHPFVSGNKWRKLKYNLLDARSKGYSSLLTFGGAFSNHLYAVAAAGNALGMRTVGIVRGEDHSRKETDTLRFCRKQGMEINYVSRQEYKLRHDTEYLKKVSYTFDHSYIIPEGGTTTLALQGVGEMVTETEKQINVKPDYYAVAAGTGGTAAGILSMGSNVLAVSALKGGGFLRNDIDALLDGKSATGDLELFTDYHFGGYARWNSELIEFIKNFNGMHGIQLEQVYTGKMMYGLFDLIGKQHFPRGTTIVAVHTGGLQGLLPELRSY